MVYGSYGRGKSKFIQEIVDTFEKDRFANLQITPFNLFLAGKSISSTFRQRWTRVIF
jgi:hypothetical protein